MLRSESFLTRLRAEVGFFSHRTRGSKCFMRFQVFLAQTGWLPSCVHACIMRGAARAAVSFVQTTTTAQTTSSHHTRILDIIGMALIQHDPERLADRTACLPLSSEPKPFHLSLTTRPVQQNCCVPFNPQASLSLLCSTGTTTYIDFI